MLRGLSIIALGCALTGVASAGGALPSTTVQPASWTPSSVALADRALADVRAQGLSGDAAIGHAVRFLADEASKIQLGVRVAVGTVGGRNRDIVALDAATQTDPASNTKIANTLHVLDTLGPTYVFETPFRMDAAGVLHVEGAFDPTIEIADLRRIARRLKRQGVTQLAGIGLDSTRLAGDPTPTGYRKFGRQRWEYLARPAALAVDKARWTATITPGATAGDAGVYQTVANDPVANDVTTVPAGSQFHLGIRVRGTRNGRPLITLRGTIAADSRPRELVMRAPDAVKTFGDELVDALAAEGITVGATRWKGPAPSGARVVWRHRSAPLSTILKDSLGGSNAFDNEMLALAAATHRRAGAPVSVADGVADLRRFLRAKAQVPVAIYNASGIGAVNRFTTTDILRMLRYAQRHPQTKPFFRALAIAGEHGTLKGRMMGTPATGRLWAKTGTDGPNVALSGIVTRPGDRRAPLGFSAIASGPKARRSEARAWLDALGITLAQLEPRSSLTPRRALTKTRPVVSPR